MLCDSKWRPPIPNLTEIGQECINTNLLKPVNKMTLSWSARHSHFSRQLRTAIVMKSDKTLLAETRWHIGKRTDGRTDGRAVHINYCFYATDSAEHHNSLPASLLQGEDVLIACKLHVLPLRPLLPIVTNTTSRKLLSHPCFSYTSWQPDILHPWKWILVFSGGKKPGGGAIIGSAVAFEEGGLYKKQ